MKHRRNKRLFGFLFILLGLLCGGSKFFQFPSSNEAYAAQLKSVQSGTATIAAGTSSTTATITSITTSKAFVVFSARLGSTIVDPADGQVSGQITNSTTLTFARSGTVDAINIKWYVAEFSSGVTVQRGAQAISAATTDISITSVDTTKSFVLISVWNTGTAYGRDDYYEARLTSATNLRLNIAALGASTPRVEWQVVEYTESSVQSGQVSFATTDTSKTATVTSVDTSKSWLIYSYQFDDNATINPNVASIRGQLTNATTLTFDRYASGDAATITYFLVEFTDGTTVQSGSQNFATTDTQKNATIRNVDTSWAIAASGLYMRGGKTEYATDDNPNPVWFTLDLTSATNLQITRGVTGSATADAGWFVVQFIGNPTAVLLSSFTATEYEGKVLLQWKTGWETNNLGFNVYREEDGQLIQVNSELISGGAFLAGAKRATAGHSYAWLDNELSAISDQPSDLSHPLPNPPPSRGRDRVGVKYWLEDVDLSGKRTMNGPVTPEVSDEPLPQKAMAALMSQMARQEPEKDTISRRLLVLQNRLRNTQPPAQITPPPTLPPRGEGTGWGGPGPRSSELVVSGVDTGSKKGTLPSGPLNLSDRPGQIVSLPSGQQKKLTPQEVQWVLAGSPGLKLFIQEEGWYRVTQPELVAAGLDPRVNPRLLQLYVDGAEQAITVRVKKDGQFGSQDSIEFYGTGLDTPSTDTRVYWLVAGAKPGQRVSLVGTLTGQAGAASFPYTVEKKPRTMYFAALKNGDASNFFGPMVWTTPVDQVLSLSHLDPAPPGEVTLEVSLQGATAGTHLVQVQLNGVQVGSLVFADQSLGVVTLSVSQSLLLEGDNRVTLVAQGGEMDVSMIDSIRLTYWHTYTADNDALRFTASGGQQLFIDGFSSSQVRVVDITDPKVVQEVVGQVNLQGSGYAVQFGVPGSGPRTLLAFTGDQVKSVAAVEANQTSRWYQAGGSADLVVITHGSFLESLQPLKALRQSQGLGVAMVDVEDIYDEFSFGVKTPQALKDFLLRAKTHWQKPPRFVLLVGDASVDPRNYLGLGNFDWVPTKLIDTAVLETASDDWFGDFSGDGLPKMAVGRLPVRTVEEAQIVVSKIVGYEQSAQSLRDVLLVADMKGGEDDYDFEVGSLEVQGLLPAGLTVYQIFRGQFSDDVQVHSQLLGRINEGKLLVNYLGHGSEAIWRGDILTLDDRAALTNGLRLPFVVSMTCLNGFFQDVYGESLAEALLKAPQGGAIAVWASSGLTEPGGQTMMDKELVRLLFNGESLTLGEATARAKSATGDGDVRRTWILFGDPTTKLKY